MARSQAWASTTLGARLDAALTGTTQHAGRRIARFLIET